MATETLSAISPRASSIDTLCSVLGTCINVKRIQVTYAARDASKETEYSDCKERLLAKTDDIRKLLSETITELSTIPEGFHLFERTILLTYLPSGEVEERTHKLVEVSKVCSFEVAG